MSTISSLSRFNRILKESIEKANLYEKNQLWKEARDQWLDIIEYCLLFAKKTPELKPETAKMITTKAQALLARVEKIDEKLDLAGADTAGNVPGQRAPAAGDEAVPPREPEGLTGDLGSSLVEPPAGDSPGKDAGGVGGIVPGNGGESSHEMGALETVTGKHGDNNGAGMESGKFIEVGDVKIDIPEDFPLVEITPEDSFQPPSIEPETMKIDVTKHYIGENQQDAPGNQPPARSGEEGDHMDEEGTRHDRARK